MYLKHLKNTLTTTSSFRLKFIVIRLVEIDFENSIVDDFHVTTPNK